LLSSKKKDFEIAKEKSNDEFREKIFEFFFADSFLIFSSKRFAKKNERLRTQKIGFFFERINV